MKTFLLTSVLGCFLVTAGYCQKSPQTSAEQIPTSHVMVLINNKPWDKARSFPEGHVKHIALKAYLDSTSVQTFQGLEREVIVRRAVISLAKGNRRVMSINWEPGTSIMPLATQARSGDRFVIEVSELNARMKDGTLKRLPMTGSEVYSIPVN